MYQNDYNPNQNQGNAFGYNTPNANPNPNLNLNQNMNINYVPMQTNETAGVSLSQYRSNNEMQFIPNQQQQQPMPGIMGQIQNQIPVQSQSYYMPPKMPMQSSSPSNNYPQSHPIPLNTTSSNNTAIASRLIEIDTRISKYSDFSSINYGMFIWSLLCFISSIWSITNTDCMEHITYDKDDKEIIVRTNSFNAYNILCFFVNLIHCVAYFYAIRSYNKQSKIEMNYCHYFYVALGAINVLFFAVYIFFVHSGFFTFCINLMFLIFNVMLYFQSVELTRLYEEKENMKMMYI